MVGSRPLPGMLPILLPLISFAGCMGPPPKFEGEVGRGTNLWPLLDVAYSRDGRDVDILWPLLAFDNKIDQKLYAFRPVFMIRTDPEHRITSADFLFPVLHLGETGTRKEYACRPLFGVWRDPKNEMTDIDFLSPLGYFRSEPGKLWFQLRPFIWYKRVEDSGYFHGVPFYGVNRDGPRARYWFLMPFFTYWMNSSTTPPDWTFNALWPLIHLGSVGGR